MPKPHHDQPHDYQSRYFALLEDKVNDNATRLDHHEKRIDRLGNFIDRDHGRINTMWDHVFGAEKKRKSELLPFWDDPRVRKALGWIALAVLILAAAAVNFDLRELV